MLKETGGKRGLAVALAAGLAFVGMPAAPASAADTSAGHMVEGVFITDAYTIRRGGRLYDNWAEELGTELPTDTHPSYPADAKKSGKTTWRCKECHGWDLKGKDGVYSSGSHYTGIPGIGSFAMRSPDQLIATLRDDTHQYTADMIPDEAVSDLAHFLAFGRINFDGVVDDKTKVVQGDMRHGAEIFQTVCSVCHGLDGKLINFGSDEKPEYVGTVASDNPWEALHKIRFGSAGSPMVGLFPFTLEDQLDVLSYAQTLPSE